MQPAHVPSLLLQHVSLPPNILTFPLSSKEFMEGTFGDPWIIPPKKSDALDSVKSWWWEESHWRHEWSEWSLLRLHPPNLHRKHCWLLFQCYIPNAWGSLKSFGHVLENTCSSKLHNSWEISLKFQKPYRFAAQPGPVKQSSPKISLENRWVEGNVWLPWSIKIGNLSSFQAPQRRFLWNHKLVFLLPAASISEVKPFRILKPMHISQKTVDVKVKQSLVQQQLDELWFLKAGLI